MAGLFRATSTVALFTLFSRVLGFFRDMVIARSFGASLAMDAFLVAFKIPNFMRRLFAEGAFSQAFVPVLSEYQAAADQKRLMAFISQVFGCLASVLLLITSIGIIASPGLVHLFAPGFTAGESRFLLASHMLKITFPYLLFISLTAFAAGILNSYQRFALPALTPMILNVCMIIAAWFCRSWFHEPVVALAWGVVISGFLQLTLQLWAVARMQLLPFPRINWAHPGVKKMLGLMIPTLIGSSVSQVNLLLDTMFASFLQVGSVSWLYYSDRLVWFPLGIFGVAIATVILPHLSRAHQQDQKRYSATMDWAIQCDLLIGIPASVALFILAQPLFATLFRYGHFSARDTLMASQSLQAFSVGLLAFMLTKVLTTAFYARQDTKTPMRIAIVCVISNFLMNLIFIKPLAHVGLALSISLASWINVLSLLYLLLKRDIYRPALAWGGFLLKVLLANAVMAGFLYYFGGQADTWLAYAVMQRIWHLLSLMTAGLVLYLLMLIVLGIPLMQLIKPTEV